MKKEKEYIPSLDDIAFERRNKTYGAYYLRKRYSRFLLISTVTATIVFLILVAIPILSDIFWKEPVYDDMMPMMEFYSLNPPSDDELSAMANALKAPPVADVLPLVVDTVKPEKQVVKEEPEPEQPEVPESDSLQGGSGGNDKDGTGPGEDTGIYTTIDVYPRFPGGDQARFYFLRANIHYPESAVKAGIQGVVMVVFVIEVNGSVSNVEVSKGIGSGCDEEAIRVVKTMPPWEPGRRSGKAVRVLVRMPIVFRIPGKTQ